jgi:hypothetical protein
MRRYNQPGMSPPRHFEGRLRYDMILPNLSHDDGKQTWSDHWLDGLLNHRVRVVVIDMGRALAPRKRARP